MALHVETADRTIPQYPLGQLLLVWAAATVPMGLLAWVVAPRLAVTIGGDQPFARALIGCMTAGLALQFLLVVLLVRVEQGSLRWSVVRSALWLRAPMDPNTGRRGGRVWWWVLPYFLGFAAVQFLPGLPSPGDRDLAVFLESAAGRGFLAGRWDWFAVVVAMAVLNTVLGEELLFRGFLLPRMRGVFGRSDWVANGVLFALYHLHMPWVIPTALLDTVLFSYPSRRHRSAWPGIIVHSGQSVVIVLVVLAVVAG